jgi:hypothetical protein
MRHALVAVLLAFVPCLAQAQKAPAPDEASLASIQLPRFTPPTYDTVVPELFHVELEGGELRTVAYTEPHADGMVKMTATDGGFDYVPMYRIKHIIDQDGRDVTRDVVFRRLNLGSFEGQSFLDPRAITSPRAARGLEPFRSLRFTAAPANLCRGYVVTDFAAMIRDRGYSTEHFYTIDLGYVRNLGRDYSLGGTAFLGALGTSSEQVGVRVRATRWLSQTVSLDVAPGVVLWEDRTSYARFKPPGLAAQAALNLQGHLGLVLQVLSLNRRVSEYWYPYPPVERVENVTSWHFGIRLGGELGIAGAAAFAFAESMDGKRYYPVGEY